MFESRVFKENGHQMAWNIAPQDSKVFDFNKEEEIMHILALNLLNLVQKRRS